MPIVDALSKAFEGALRYTLPILEILDARRPREPGPSACVPRAAAGIGPQGAGSDAWLQYPAHILMPRQAPAAAAEGRERPGLAGPHPEAQLP